MRRELFIGLFLTVATLVVFWQVGNHAFIHVDDSEYVTDNVHVNTGLSWDNLTWAFTSTHAANWHPLTWLSHMLDCELFDLNPKGHHLTSVLFHLVNTLLLFLILRWMTGALWRSGLVAALFALHPLHVESVAWVAERKDVLSTFFLFLTLLSYIWYVQRSGFYRYLLIILFFTLGLMAKPMVVTLPFVLLLLDYWPLERIRLAQSGSSHAGQSHPSTFTKKPKAQAFSLLLEKTPLFVLAAGSCLVTFLVQRSGGAVGALEVYPFYIRVANGLVSYVNYIIKMIWPQNLAVFYPHPGQGLPMWQAAGAGLLLLVISIAVIRLGRRYPYLPVGWLWYVGTLVPVIGLVQVGAQAMADRYTYVPLIGLFFMIAWGVTDLLGSWRYGKPALAVAATILLSALMVCTTVQVSYWKNSLTLFEHTLRATSHNSQIHNNLGNVLTQKGKLQEAIAHYTKALEISPNYAEAQINLGVALTRQGRLKEAIKHYSAALELKSNSAELHNNLGVALFGLGDIPGAIRNYLAAVQLKPDYAEAHNNLGNGLVKLGKLSEAEIHYGKALKLRADYPEAHNNLGVALARQGRLKEAIAHFREAVRLAPNFAQARTNLELALQEAGNSN
ncbi:MAG: tetratricopeptide repeat protein [Deltaproteobacteria bacterium]|jgi:Flp pilus assembly protein TadD